MRSLSFHLTTRTLFIGLVLFLSPLLPMSAHANQYDLPNGSWSTDFAYPGLDGTVTTTCWYGGNLVVGGLIESAGGVPVVNVAMWENGDWHPLGEELDGTVHALAVFGGSLYAGGTFETYESEPMAHFARWTGSAWVEAGGGCDGTVSDLVEYGGMLVAGGSFDSAGGLPYPGIAAWTGASWQPLGSGIDGMVFALELYGSSLAVGGRFDQAGDVFATKNIALWDGSVWSPLHFGVDLVPYYTGAVHAIAASGGDLYVGGSFNAASSVELDNVARWDGAAWHAMGDNVSGSVRGIGVTPQGILAGGNYYIDDVGFVDGIALWHDDAWHDVGGLVGSGYGVHDLGTFVLVNGGFETTGDAVTHGLAAWDGASWSGYLIGTAKGMDGSVRTLCSHDGRVYAGGEFNGAGSTYSPGVAAWNGAHWESVGGGVDSYVRDASVFDGRLIVGGGFGSAGGLPLQRIAAWDGLAWTALGDGFNSTVQAVAVHDGVLYAGGAFTASGAVDVSHIARWSGTAWEPLAEGVSDLVTTLISTPAGLVVGGEFTTAGTSPVQYVARWDSGVWSAMGEGTPGIPHDMLMYEGALHVVGGGDWMEAPRSFVSRWDGTSSTWEAVGGWDATLWGDVETATVFGDALVVGGSFNQSSGHAADRLAFWDGAQWNAFAPGGPDQVVYAALGLGDHIYLGGDFETIDGIQSHNFAVWEDVATPVELAFPARRSHVGVSIDLSPPCGDCEGIHVWRETVGASRVKLTAAPLPGCERSSFYDQEAGLVDRTYWVEALVTGAPDVWYGPYHVDGGVPMSGASLRPAAPNPFNPTTVLTFSLPKPGRARLTIHDTRGRCVRVLEDEILAAGDHVRDWDGRSDDDRTLAAGSYLAVLQYRGGKYTQRLSLVK